MQRLAPGGSLEMRRGMRCALLNSWDIYGVLGGSVAPICGHACFAQHM